MYNFTGRMAAFRILTEEFTVNMEGIPKNLRPTTT